MLCQIYENVRSFLPLCSVKWSRNWDTNDEIRHSPPDESAKRTFVLHGKAFEIRNLIETYARIVLVRGRRRCDRWSQSVITTRARLTNPQWMSVIVYGCVNHGIAKYYALRIFVRLSPDIVESKRAYSRRRRRHILRVTVPVLIFVAAR